MPLTNQPIDSAPEQLVAVPQDDLGRILGRQDVRGRHGRALGRHARLVDELLVQETFAIYERGSPELRLVRREPDVHPSVAAAAAVEASLSALVDAALAPFDVPAQECALARAMVDLNTWEALRSAGLDAPSAEAAVSEMLAARATVHHDR